VLVVLVLAYLIKAAVGDAFAMAAIIASYQRETANLTPDPEMEARLEQVSVKFRELKQHALDAVRSSAVSQPAVSMATERAP
jgi:hypothetical protein